MYLRPLGIIGGDAARPAIEGGWALPLCGGEAAFTACEIWRRRPDGIERASPPGSGPRRLADASAATRCTRPLAQLLRAPDRAAQLAARACPTPPADHGRGQRHPGQLLRRRAVPRAGRGDRARAARCTPKAPTSSTSAANSTRPGADAVSADEEIRRVVPVIEALAGGGRPGLDRYPQGRGDARRDRRRRAA